MKKLKRKKKMIAVDEASILVDFPYTYQFVDVLQSKLAYIEHGKGDPILFLHGVPTSSYLWRNVIPYVATVGRCLSLDLIGFGQSGKPDIDYSIQDHLAYLTAFMDKLALEDVTLVMHGWGSVCGFAYAMQNPSRIKKLAFYESHIRPMLNWNMMALPVQEFARGLKSIEDLENKILHSDYFMEKMFPIANMRQLSAEEISYYKAPFQSASDRRPLITYMREVPWLGQNMESIDFISHYSEQLVQSSIPKLLMFAIPGFITTIDMVTWAKENLSHLTLCDLGDAMHYAQETNPELMGKILAVWIQSIDAK